jgi:hypothetical protein
LASIANDYRGAVARFHPIQLADLRRDDKVRSIIQRNDRQGRSEGWAAANLYKKTPLGEE